MQLARGVERKVQITGGFLYNVEGLLAASRLYGY